MNADIAGHVADPEFYMKLVKMVDSPSVVSEQIDVNCLQRIRRILQRLEKRFDYLMASSESRPPTCSITMGRLDSDHYRKVS